MKISLTSKDSLCRINYPWFEGSNPSDNFELWNLSVFLCHVSLAFFMRLRLVSVVGEFLWSGEWFLDHDLQCFPGGHWYPPGMLFRVCIHHNAISILIAVWTTQKHVPRWDLPAGLAGAQLGVKTPLPIHERSWWHIMKCQFSGNCLQDLETVSCPQTQRLHKRGMKNNAASWHQWVVPNVFFQLPCLCCYSCAGCCLHDVARLQRILHRYSTGKK